jgi:hypothetical protein
MTRMMLLLVSAEEDEEPAPGEAAGPPCRWLRLALSEAVRPGNCHLD